MLTDIWIQFVQTTSLVLTNTRFKIIRNIKIALIWRYFYLKALKVINTVDIKDLLLQLAYADLFMNTLDRPIAVTDNFVIKLFPTAKDPTTTLYITLKTPGDINTIKTVSIVVYATNPKEYVKYTVDSHKELVNIEINSTSQAFNFSYSKNVIDLGKKEIINECEKFMRYNVKTFMKVNLKSMGLALGEVEDESKAKSNAILK